MLVYGLPVDQIPDGLRRGDRRRTFYYLGFIYTLATLVASFAPLLNSPARPESRHVLGLFVSASITTFVGLAGRIVFAQTASGAAQPEDDARRLGDAYEDAARAIERSTVRIVHAQRRAEGHLRQSYSGAAEAIRTVIERVGADAESAFAEMRNRAILEIDAASRQAAKSTTRPGSRSRAWRPGRPAPSLPSPSGRPGHRPDRSGIGDGGCRFSPPSTAMSAPTLQQFETRLGALRLPPEDVGEKLTVVLISTSPRVPSSSERRRPAREPRTASPATLAGAVTARETAAGPSAPSPSRPTRRRRQPVGEDERRAIHRAPGRARRRGGGAGTTAARGCEHHRDARRLAHAPR